ncbi:hypothetical protein HY442_01565 [Candidatus Parcubacteria bacterium]|nr:hypothetical protein [Candidatus Parcubacteria bacterium]
MEEFFRRFWRHGIKIHLLWILIVLILAQWVLGDGVFAATWQQVLVGAAAGGGADVLLTWLRKRTLYVPQSGFITGLIVASGLMPGTALWKVVFAAAMGIAVKHGVRVQGRHIFNPAAAGLAAGMLLGAGAGWWLDQLPWSVALFGAFIVSRTRKWPTVLAFLLVWFFGSALQVGFRGAASTTPFFFTAVMLIEPMTTPAWPKAQAAYGAFVGILTVFLVFRTSLGALAALLLGNIMVPLAARYISPARAPALHSLDPVPQRRSQTARRVRP